MSGWKLDELAHAGPEHLDAGYVAGYDRKAGLDPAAAPLELLRELGLDGTGTLVDLGAGTGRLALAAARVCRRVVAVDVSSPMLAALGARAEREGLENVECVRAGFLTYVHEGAPADVVFSRNALHHLPDFWKGIALQRVAAMLRPGGALRLQDLVYCFDPAEAEAVIEAWLASASAGPEEGWTRPELEEHVREEHSTYAWLLEGDAPASGARDPRGELQPVAHVRRLHLHQDELTGGRGSRALRFEAPARPAVPGTLLRLVAVAVERYTFPFTAIVGQERMKLALILNAINPSIGGVLIRGEKGTAKSTAVRALARLLPEQDVVEGCHFGCHPEDVEALCSDCRLRFEDGENPLPSTQRRMRVVELPINASEDRVVGTIDLEAALKEGSRRFEPGVLAEANRNILYVDEVNLLDDHIVDVLLDAAAMGVNVVEREGVSIAHPARFILVGTMNPEEGELRPQLLDRFGLCVDVEGIRDLDRRVEIVEQRASWEGDPVAFFERHASDEEQVRVRIAEAISTFPEIDLPRSILRLIAQLSIALEVDGHRSDLVCARAAQAKAAYDSADVVGLSHVTEVAQMVFSHRLRAVPFGKAGPNLGEVISRIVGQS